MSLIKRVIITDIGSTSTKLLVLKKENEHYAIATISDSPTTVEKPYEDVRIGVYNAIKTAEKELNELLLQAEATPNDLRFQEDVIWLTTSSAGGGLQILVVGLTLSDSAKSAQRAAYGAGGVILDTLAIDDKRSVFEQMSLIDHLHPDMILMSGGIDGGAWESVIRMAEVLHAAEQKPKFTDQDTIPLIYAGNKDAVDAIQTIFTHKYDLHILPNIRPELMIENTDLAQDKIHELFLTNVMEHAPGYSAVKKNVEGSIIPTPSAVLTALKKLYTSRKQNILAVDIGGATTDVFSTINGKFYRTVSANLGMSYSIANVLAEAGLANIMQHLPEDYMAEDVTNYIANKMLYPTQIPLTKQEQMVEYAVAIEALRMARQQHMAMNFNVKRIGFLDHLKNMDFCKYHETFYTEKAESDYHFHSGDIHLIIGIGGLFAHLEDPFLCIRLIASGFELEGITEIWRDKHFLSPHVGKLLHYNDEMGTKLLTDCYENVGFHVKPYFNKKSNKPLLFVTYTKDDNLITYEMRKDELLLVAPVKGKTVEIQLTKEAVIEEDKREYTLSADNWIVINTMTYEDRLSEDILNQYKRKWTTNREYMPNLAISEGKRTITKRLPYQGITCVNEGDIVTAEKIVAENQFAPPRLYVLQTCKSQKMTEEQIRNGLTAKVGDEIKAGQVLFKGGKHNVLGTEYLFDSPVRAIIEDIHYPLGIIFAREIQDYSIKPVTIHLAEKICVKPKYLKGCMKKELGDFIYAGDVLAKKKITPKEAITGDYLYIAHTTGTLTDINTTTGTVTIQYQQKTFQLKAGVKGIITRVVEGKEVDIEMDGITIQAMLGIGKEVVGKLCFVQETELEKEMIKGMIVALSSSCTKEQLEYLKTQDIKGLIVPSISYLNLVEYYGKELGVALTGNEELAFPIIITECLGANILNKEIESVFGKHNGKTVCLLPQTQIRAGVVRPLILFSKEDN